MDFYASMTSWSIFAVAVGAGCWYYWPEGQQPPKRATTQQDKGQGRKNKSEADARGRSIRRLTSEDNLSTGTEKVPNLAETAARKRKAQHPKTEQPTFAPQLAVDEGKEEKESEADKQWAQRMAQTQKGTNLSATSKKEKKPKTVKQSSAVNTPEISAQQSPQMGSDADEGNLVDTPMLNAGDVNDMLEPVAPGPSVLRITPSTKPQKEKAPKKAKHEEVETKKQRQNRAKVEERRVQREAEEKDRKALEEKQRRAAREARGEPARNGIPASKPPASNAWQQQRSPAAPPSDTTVTPQVDSNVNQPLLDTFDADSTASSLAPSTTATSTEDGENGSQSYQDQITQAKRNSEDDGWTTVAQPKKSKKKEAPTATPTSEPVLSNKKNGQKATPAVNGKPKGFQALYVPDESTGSDPSDPSNWDA